MPCNPENLPKTPEWKALTDAERAAFARFGRPQHYAAGETIFQQGDDCNGIYVICKGLISRHLEDSGGNIVTLRLAHKSDILGYRALLAGEPHMTSAQVIEDTDVCFYPASQVKVSLLTHIGFGMALLQREASELGQAEARFHEAVTQHLRFRLLHLLLDLKDDFGTNLANGDILLEFPISRKEMASMIGVRVETLSREIHRLKDEGLVEFSGHRAWLKDLAAIEDEVSAKGALH